MSPFGPSVMTEFDKFLNFLDTLTPSNKLSALKKLKSLGEYHGTAECIAKSVCTNMQSLTFVSGDACVRDEMKKFINTEYFHNIIEIGRFIDKFNAFLKKARMIPQIMLGTITTIRTELKRQGKNTNYLGGIESTPLMAIFSNDLLTDAYTLQKHRNIGLRDVAEKLIKYWRSENIIPDDGNVQFQIFAVRLSFALVHLEKLKLNEYTDYTLEETIRRYVKH